MNIAHGRMRLLYYVALFLIVLASRLPFLHAGYGVDGDAWRVADAARCMCAEKTFCSSRVPGHPVSDILSALAYPGGPMAVNGLSALWSAIAVVLMAHCLSLMGVRSAPWFSLAVAFTPGFYIASVTSLDYAWAMAFILLSLFFILKNRPVGAGIMLALAVGCRLTSLSFIIPFGLGLYWTRPREHRWIGIGFFGLACMITGALVYSPVLIKYGLSYVMQHWDDPYPGWAIRLAMSVLQLFGVIGLITLASLGGAALFRPRSVLREIRCAWAEPRWVFFMAWAAVILQVAVFIPLPHEGAYLIPVLPFAAVLLDRLFTQRAMVVLCLGMMVSSLALNVYPRPAALGDAREGVCWKRPVGQLEVAVSWKGPIFTDHALRLNYQAYATRILTTLAEQPRPFVAIVGGMEAMLDEMSRGKRGTQGVFVNVLDAAAVEEWKHRGYVIYYLPAQRVRSLHYYGFDLAQTDAIPLVPRADSNP